MFWFQPKPDRPLSAVEAINLELARLHELIWHATDGADTIFQEVSRLNQALVDLMLKEKT